MWVEVLSLIKNQFLHRNENKSASHREYLYVTAFNAIVSKYAIENQHPHFSNFLFISVQISFRN